MILLLILSQYVFGLLGAVLLGEVSPMEKQWQITKDGVGNIKINKSLPSEVLTEELLQRYRAGYYADGIAYDGFRLENPPILVLLDSGPFIEKAKKGNPDPNDKSLVTKALSFARKKAKVKMIVIEDQEVRTDKGIGINSTLSDLKTAYDDTVLHPVPPTFGDDECVAMTKKLPNVHFYFPNCKSAEGGCQIRRILIFKE